MSAWYKWRKLSEIEKNLLNAYAIFIGAEIPSLLQIVTFAAILGYLTSNTIVIFLTIYLLWRYFFWAKSKEGVSWRLPDGVPHPRQAKSPKEIAQIRAIGKRVLYYEWVIIVITSMIVSLIVSMIVDNLPK